MKQERLGTFEEWYQWEMKQRASKRKWHYPTVLTFRDVITKDPKTGKKREIQVVRYETR